MKVIKKTQDASTSFKNVQMFYCSNARLFRVNVDISTEHIGILLHDINRRVFK